MTPALERWQGREQRHVEAGRPLIAQFYERGFQKDLNKLSEMMEAGAL